MDETSARRVSIVRETKDGFPGQRLRVLPPPVVKAALAKPPSSRLVVTDAGYFPSAGGHLRRRKHGTTSTIVILCQSGAGFIQLGGVRTPVTRGDLVVIPAREPHEYGADDADPWTIWWLHAQGEDVAALLAATPFSTDRPVLPLVDPERAQGLIAEALSSLEMDDSLPRVIAAAGAALHLLALLPMLADAPRQERGPVARTRDFLTQRLPERTSLQEAAAHVSLSPSHLARLFREELGYGPLEYQTRLRLASAAELLHTSSRSIASISRSVGYADHFYFSRQFKRYYGVPPREYRRVVEHGSA